MSSEFEDDRARIGRELEAARQELLAVVTSLGDADLERGRRGGWTVRRALEHVTYSEQAYARIVTHLRGLPPLADIPDCKPASARHATQLLATSREALLAALEGVDEETFYRLAPVGHEEYSVISLLENEINHEREHAAQIRGIVSG
jgi:uncharacterized damage-inducible protein DinB